MDADLIITAKLLVLDRVDLSHRDILNQIVDSMDADYAATVEKGRVTKMLMFDGDAVRAAQTVNTIAGHLPSNSILVLHGVRDLSLAHGLSALKTMNFYAMAVGHGELNGETYIRIIAHEMH
jgi:hypothetical protein